MKTIRTISGRRMRRVRRVVIGLAGVAGLASAACGGGSDVVAHEGTIGTALGDGQGYTLVTTNDHSHEIAQIAVSDDYLFFSIEWHGLYRMPKYGGAIEPVDADTNATFTGIASNGSDVFWRRSTFGPNDEPHVKIERRAAAGGAVTVMAEQASSLQTSFNPGMLSDTTNIYVQQPDLISVLPFDGGAASEIPVAPHPAGAPWYGSWVPDYPSFYLSGCTASDSCALSRIDLSTGASENLLALDAGVYSDIVGAVDASSVFMIKNRHIISLSKADLTLTDVFTPQPDEYVFWFLLVDASNVYFITYGTPAGWQLRSVPKSGGPSGGTAQLLGGGEQLARGVWGVAQDRQFVFVLAAPPDIALETGNAILAFPKVPAAP